MKAYNYQTLEKFHVHLETKNTSFLKMAALLRKMGVKNCYFHLKLIDKGLKDVDPYDPDLSTEMKFRVFKECRDNRWYFYREVFRVAEGGASTAIGGGSPFILNRGNLAYLWATELNLSTYLIMPRQEGKTWAAIADCVWTHQFIRGSTILHFNKNQKDANDNLARIQSAISMLPMYLQHSSVDNLEAKDKRLVKNNEKTIKNILNSTIEAMASAGNESKADSLARGRTASKIWWDELAFIFFNETIYTAATPAYEKAKDVAIKHGAPYGISITTTPGDLATPHGAWAYKMMESSVPFRESYYDYSMKELDKEINKRDDRINILFIQYSYLQLGETEEWYLERFKKLANPLKARREYLLEWINTNGNSPFDPDDVELIGEMAREKADTVQIYKINKYYDLYVYDEYYGKKPVLISVDVAGKLGRDSSAIVVANPDTLKPIAIFKSNMVDLNKFKKLIYALVTKRYPNCILTIENNSIGEGLIRELLDTSIGGRIYREKKKRTVDQGVNAVTRKRKMDSIEYGHNTNTQTRQQMMEILESVVHNSPAHLGYPELYNEIRFLELKNGRIDHSSATHDDVVMAYMGLLWVVRYGTGLKGRGIYYNIDDADVMEDEDRPDFNHAKINHLLGNDYEELDDDGFTDYMKHEHHNQTSSDLAAAERAEYFHALDKAEGVEPDDDGFNDASISESTKMLILNSYNSFRHLDPYDDDPVSTLAEDPVFAMLGGEDDTWSTLYSY